MNPRECNSLSEAMTRSLSQGPRKTFSCRPRGPTQNPTLFRPASTQDTRTWLCYTRATRCCQAPMRNIVMSGSTGHPRRTTTMRPCPHETGIGHRRHLHLRTMTPREPTLVRSPERALRWPAPRLPLRSTPARPPPPWLSAPTRSTLRVSGSRPRSRSGQGSEGG